MGHTWARPPGRTVLASSLGRPWVSPGAPRSDPQGGLSLSPCVRPGTLSPRRPRIAPESPWFALGPGALGQTPRMDCLYVAPGCPRVTPRSDPLAGLSLCHLWGILGTDCLHVTPESYLCIAPGATPECPESAPGLTLRMEYPCCPGAPQERPWIRLFLCHPLVIAGAPLGQTTRWTVRVTPKVPPCRTPELPVPGSPLGSPQIDISQLTLFDLH